MNSPSFKKTAFTKSLLAVVTVLVACAILRFMLPAKSMNWVVYFKDKQRVICEPTPSTPSVMYRFPLQPPFGYVDAAGNIIVERRFNESGLTADYDRIMVQDASTGLYGYVNFRQEPCISLEFTLARPFCSELAAARYGQLWGYIGLDGSWVIQPTFGIAYDFVGQYAVVGNVRPSLLAVVGDTKSHINYFVIDRTGARVCECKDLRDVAAFYSDPHSPEPIIANHRVKYAIQEGGLLAGEYDEAYWFHCGIARVRKYNGWYYINTNGDRISSDSYAVAWDAVHGVYWARTFDGFDLISRTDGTEVLRTRP